MGLGASDAMKNIFLVLKREYLVRVRKKSFIVMTILTPVLIAAFYGIIVWAAVGSFKNERKTIEVIDQSGLFKNKFKSDKTVRHEQAEYEKRFRKYLTFKILFRYFIF